MFFAVNFGTRVRMSSHDYGGSTPTSSNTFLFQNRTIGCTVSHGIAPKRVMELNSG